MKKVLRSLLLIPLVVAMNLAFTTTKEKVNWISLKELQSAYSKQAKPIIIDVYTGWCGWCKVMDKETYSNQKVADYINENYYAVKFDAESIEPVILNSIQYHFNSSNRVHDLAMYLLNGQVGYPTTVLLSSLNARPAPIPGYMNPGQLEAPLKYFGGGSFKKQDYPAFMKEFAPTW